jgi:hypothetical protein
VTPFGGARTASPESIITIGEILLEQWLWIPDLPLCGNPE